MHAEHAELIAANGMYADLYNRQFAAIARSDA